jgi:hypothetical protein
MSYVLDERQKDFFAQASIFGLVRLNVQAAIRKLVGQKHDGSSRVAGAFVTLLVLPIYSLHFVQVAYGLDTATGSTSISGC